MDSLDCISVRKDKLEKHTIIHVSQIYFREKKCVFPKQVNLKMFPYILLKRTSGTFSAMTKTRKVPSLPAGGRGWGWASVEAQMLVHHVLSGRMLVELRPGVSLAARDPSKKRGAGWDESA